MMQGEFRRIPSIYLTMPTFLLILFTVIIPLSHAATAPVPFLALQNKRLSTPPVSVVNVQSGRHCSQRCIQSKENCTAFNVIQPEPVELPQEQEEGNEASPAGLLQCEMLSGIPDPDMLVEDETATFWQLNYCHGHLCANGAECRIQGEGYVCVCVEGYTGQYCETDINECSRNPCQNGGTCTDLVAGYTCQCQAGWEGMHCHININECASNPCLNGGACTDRVNRYTCSCPVAYKGIRCQTEVNECASNPCQNGGTCIDRVGMWKCNCKSDYEGTKCQTKKPGFWG